MVGMWISQGYIHTESWGNKSVEEIGSEYFDNLLSRSFIQSSYGGMYALHDLLHDLAESVSEDEYHKINSKEMKENTSSVRHVYVHSNNLSVLKSFKLRKLRTLIIDGKISNDYNALKEVLNGLKSIRVLALEVSVQFLSGSIKHLIHLRYLTVNSSYQSMSPIIQCRPYHLQWLIYKGCGNSVLPAATNYLELKHFKVGMNEGQKLAELKRLNELRGTLTLRSLDNASTKEEALEAKLNKKVGIRKLNLACDNGHATPRIAEEVFEGLCPPPYIKELSVKGYLGVESPTWMMSINCCLSVLQSLTLGDCLKLKVLPPLGQLPSLRHLVIYRANAVEEIDSCFYGSGVAQSFPCLETLEFRFMPGWVVWSGANGGTDSLFPRLCRLTVMYCPKLERVPMQCLAPVEVLHTSCMVLLAELEYLTSLKKLILGPTWKAHSREMQTLPLLTASLVTLEISYCDQLSSLFTPETETNLPSLRVITISHCNQLVSVELKRLPSLKEL